MFQGRLWLTSYNKCLTTKLLPLYSQSSIDCLQLRHIMFQDRIDCLVDSGFCCVTDDTSNRYAIGIATDLLTYPDLLPDKKGLSTIGRRYFYSQMSSFRRLMGYANYVCFAKGKKKHKTPYTRVRTATGFRMVEQN